ncbi:MAG: hypothetical protein QOJ69_1894 [Actinomycetota bacterium]|nr:hypothetical protein [Actinomycetota bacterium]
MGDRLGNRGLGNAVGGGGAGRWPRRAADFDQGVWFLLLAGFLVLVSGVIGLFLELDGAATAAALVAGAALCGLSAVLFSMASPRYVGTATLVAETLFDYTDAKARLAAVDMPDELRDPFRRMARGEAAAAYLEVVLRDTETVAEPGGQGATASPMVDVERIAGDAAARARESLRSATARSYRPLPSEPAPPPAASLVGADTLEQPMPERPGVT